MTGLEYLHRLTKIRNKTRTQLGSIIIINLKLHLKWYTDRYFWSFGTTKQITFFDRKYSTES